MACHQQGGTGKMGFAPSIRNRDFLAIASDEFIRETIQKGRVGTAMVARPDLSEAVVSDIIAYLRDLPIKNQVVVELDNEKVVQGDRVAGGKKFELYCAACHGDKGQGYISGGPGPGIGLAGFLNTASDDYILQTVKLGRIGTSMKSFIGAKGVANLEEQDVNDIIVFLRSLND
jgi:cytochrome c oxidase cbb3-type subunit 3